MRSGTGSRPDTLPGTGARSRTPWTSACSRGCCASTRRRWSWGRRRRCPRSAGSARRAAAGGGRGGGTRGCSAGRQVGLLGSGLFLAPHGRTALAVEIGNRRGRTEERAFSEGAAADGRAAGGEAGEPVQGFGAQVGGRGEAGALV